MKNLNRYYDPNHYEEQYACIVKFHVGYDVEIFILGCVTYIMIQLIVRYFCYADSDLKARYR